jgi:hypothetical protein
VADWQSYDTRSNVCYERRVLGRFFPDAGNQPTFVTADNLYIASIVWTSQGLYTVTLTHAYKRFVFGHVAIQFSGAPGNERAPSIGSISNVGTSTPVSFQILVLDGAGAVQNPAAANANNSISFEMVFSDIAAV